MAPAYSATKAYQINYMETLRKKAFKSGGHITVTDIRPGLVDTAMAKGDGLFWVMPVNKVANQIISAIRKKKTKHTSPNDGIFSPSSIRIYHSTCIDYCSIIRVR